MLLYMLFNFGSRIANHLKQAHKTQGGRAFRAAVKFPAQRNRKHTHAVPMLEATFPAARRRYSGCGVPRTDRALDPRCSKQKGLA